MLSPFISALQPVKMFESKPKNQEDIEERRNDFDKTIAPELVEATRWILPSYFEQARKAYADGEDVIEIEIDM